MWKQVSWFMVSGFVLFSLVSGLGAEDEYVVTNPNYDAYITAHPLETKPRDAAVIAAEKQLLVDAAQAVVEYVKAYGVEQAAAEITKGVNGAFANYCIGPQFKLQFFQFTATGPNGEAGDFVIMKGHNLFLPMVGGTYPIDTFADLSGWKFMIETHKAASSPQGRGWVKNILWLDEFWAGNNIVRYINYSQQIDRAQGLVITNATALDE